MPLLHRSYIPRTDPNAPHIMLEPSLQNGWPPSAMTDLENHFCLDSSHGSPAEPSFYQKLHLRETSLPKINGKLGYKLLWQWPDDEQVLTRLIL
jgi:hypothetical protein